MKRGEYRRSLVTRETLPFPFPLYILQTGVAMTHEPPPTHPFVCKPRYRGDSTTRHLPKFGTMVDCPLLPLSPTSVILVRRSSVGRVGGRVTHEWRNGLSKTSQRTVNITRLPQEPSSWWSHTNRYDPKPGPLWVSFCNRVGTRWGFC